MISRQNAEAVPIAEAMAATWRAIVCASVPLIARSHL